VRLTTSGGFSYHNRGKALVLRAGRRGRAEKVGELTMLFVETPNMSEVQWRRRRDPDDTPEDGAGSRRRPVLLPAQVFKLPLR
jgi:hypothetical protein